MRDGERADDVVEATQPTADGADTPAAAAEDAPAGEREAEIVEAEPSEAPSSEPPADDLEAEVLEPVIELVQPEPEPEPEPAEPTEADLLREENARLQERLEATEARLRAVSKGFKDLRADMDSFRTRMEHQSKVKADRRSADLCERLFEPVQNLRRSIAAPASDVGGVVDGLKMVLLQFEDAMRSFGLEEIPGEGSDFDPTVHEALAVMPVTDEALDGKVVVVHNAGYKIGNQVLQPAQVIIGKYGEPAEA